ncbi:hypothetical protein GOP47_0002334 [Adiantum capillus-veneris]|uniref:Uncharacterized protein n=1 Tax=Adiantum capillus-veneris TaxID=13818 RepID=A0A9D4V9X8_ADICA|nr:hypothetical protein GOP47_0002334 [Adiantum capillus-veneris]
MARVHAFDPYSLPQRHSRLACCCLHCRPDDPLHEVLLPLQSELLRDGLSQLRWQLHALLHAQQLHDASRDAVILHVERAHEQHKQTTGSLVATSAQENPLCPPM